ncbi:MAG: glycosyltransferase family 4 protein [Verrucomicrobiota bacterium]|nr:glycosyltransferase family 4 protein [Verrucomicrobiota bacterium]
MKILSKAKLITVLGNRQLRKLISIGIQPNNICIVPNTCTVSGISTGEVISKHNNSNPIHILHLSSLIDTKGFPSYLEALLLLSKDSGPRIEATLCGPLTLSPFASRFSSNQMAEQWIIDTLAAINRSSRVKAVWIPGATGTDKWELYKRTHIFVLPTSYKVEAQPIVLLEAMAHGCALVTTRVGEIDAIVSSMEAIFLDSTDATTVASAIDKLTIDEVLRKELAMAGFSRFKKEFTLNSYVNRWELLLKECAC